MKIFNWIKTYLYKRKQSREFKKKLAELSKKDPFTYKNF